MTQIELGKKAPEIETKDYRGNDFKLSDFENKKNVLLVFNRGFIWLYCRKHMVQLHQDYHKFVGADTEVVVIGPDDEDSFKSQWEKSGIEFYGIADTEHKILDKYNQEVNIIKLGRMPAQFLVDKDGILRYIHYGKSFKDIPENDEILRIIETL